ncbi:hypothetical protein [Bacillus sp. NEAU-Y102]
MKYYVHKNHINELEACKEDLGLQPALNKMVAEDKGFQIISDFTNFASDFEFFPLNPDDDAVDELDVMNLVKRMEYIDSYVLYTVEDKTPPLNRADSSVGFDLGELIRIGTSKYFDSLEVMVRESLETKKAFRVPDMDASIVYKTFGTQFNMYIFIDCEFEGSTMVALSRGSMVMDVNNTFPVAKLVECVGKDNAIVCIREDKVIPGFLGDLEAAGIPCEVVVPRFLGTDDDWI